MGDFSSTIDDGKTDESTVYKSEKENVELDKKSMQKKLDLYTQVQSIYQIVDQLHARVSVLEEGSRQNDHSKDDDETETETEDEPEDRPNEDKLNRGPNGGKPGKDGLALAHTLHDLRSTYTNQCEKVLEKLASSKRKRDIDYQGAIKLQFFTYTLEVLESVHKRAEIYTKRRKFPQFVAACEALLEADATRAEYRSKLEEMKAKLNTEFKEKIQAIKDPYNFEQLVAEFIERHRILNTELEGKFRNDLEKAASLEASYNIHAGIRAVLFRSELKSVIEDIAKLEVGFEESALFLAEFNRTVEGFRIQDTASNSAPQPGGRELQPSPLTSKTYPVNVKQTPNLLPINNSLTVGDRNRLDNLQSSIKRR
ncbi:hypothetical protein BGZ60DRAFT_526784 [Tricladium varicosporioides]|nr:hypothetical protein BGZ60DRAFT_526784 [Hymenoscyphus varicosporioides]